MDSEPARIIIGNEAAISMAKCDKDTAGNRHVARRYHYVRQGTALKEHVFDWINTKAQVADILTKVGTQAVFKHLWDIVLYKVEQLFFCNSYRRGDGFLIFQDIKSVFYWYYESQNIFIFTQYIISLVHAHAVHAKNLIFVKFSCANNLHIIKNIIPHTYLYKELITGLYSKAQVIIDTSLGIFIYITQ